ncbi:MAG: outer membrane protein assembly factor BamA, partial [Cytophagales bacterium]
MIFLSGFLQAQNDLFEINPFGFRFNYSNPDKYTIANIDVSGVVYLDPRSLVALTGLRVGDEIKIPGDDISNAIRKLWEQGILGDIQVLITNIEGNRVSLEFVLKERPRLSRFEFVGVKKGDQDDLKDKIKLIKGKIVTDAVLKNTQNAIKKYYQEKGFYNTTVKTIQKKDTTVSNSVVVTIEVVKNRKVKVREVKFEENNVFPDKILARKLKKTKGRAPGKFWVSHKFNKTSYEEDKKKLSDFYMSKGYRDFRIDSDSLYFLPAKKPKNNKRFLGIQLNLSEGKKYYFRNIYWTGNYVHNTAELSSILNIKKGDVYDKDLLDKKLNYNPNGLDISSLYMDNGYLFFQIEPIEVLVENDSIDLEMRIHEGEQATIDKVTISGNTKTNDHVVLREIRTIPGRKFSRSDLIRSQREIATLGYFDPEKIDIQPIPNPVKGTVDINYDVTEKPSDQIQLSGGWGGFFGFVGTLGVVFNNFSARSISNFKKWDPLPAGDGQRLSLSFQANGPSFQSYAFSFTEPWLGGRKPHSFTVSLNRSVQNFGAFNTFFRSANQGSLKLNNIAVTIGKRLRWPDDYFTMSHTFSYLLYELKDYRFGVSRSNGVSQIVSDGFFNNFSVTNTIARNNIDNPTYPRRGSSISLSASLTPPYSLFQKNRDFDKETAAQRFKFVEYHKWMIDYSFFTKLW